LTTPKGLHRSKKAVRVVAVTLASAGVRVEPVTKGAAAEPKNLERRILRWQT
jgi:hypothetical protein